ncbi:hypothetical protein [Nocardia pseudobrasiliensis]|uniref:hypothetical protein n=1 Tax=Nocardia pseudobrasiliensis TaxID=45979 RepID=UPI0012E7FB69|nr:hypothetical protein [Nocardia pseudobrasiliensis]
MFNPSGCVEDASVEAALKDRGSSPATAVSALYCTPGTLITRFFSRSPSHNGFGSDDTSIPARRWNSVRTPGWFRGRALGKEYDVGLGGPVADHRGQRRAREFHHGGGIQRRPDPRDMRLPDV